MTTQDEKIKAVEAGAMALADLEIALDGIANLADECERTVTEVHKMGVGRPGEYLRAINVFRSTKGRAASSLAILIDEHMKLTEIAKREGCDAGVPARFAIGGDVQPFSGGR